MLELTRMITSSPQRKRSSTQSGWLPALFDRLTDILAEVVLEDLQKYPGIHAESPLTVATDTTILCAQQRGGKETSPSVLSNQLKES